MGRVTHPDSISFCTLDDVGQHTGTVVVIDVLRAFTTAAVALAAGARPYRLVGSVDEAHAARRQDPTVRLIGEVDAITAPGFDYGNSPSELARHHLDDRSLDGVSMVHRSSSGTQGVVRATAATRILTSSFAVAGATSRALAPEIEAGTPIAFCVTGFRDERSGDVDGDEDRACGEYIAALLATRDAQRPVDPAPYVDRVRTCTVAEKFRTGDPDLLPRSDLPFVQVVDRFDFAMEVRRHLDGDHTLHRLAPDPLR